MPGARSMASIGVGLLLLSTGAWWFWLRFETLAAPPNEPRLIFLVDGSSVWLKANAAVRFADYPTLTGLSLTGEALLEANPSTPVQLAVRPFKVVVPPGGTLWAKTSPTGAQLHAHADTLVVTSPAGTFILLPGRYVAHDLTAGQDSVWTAPVGNQLAWQNGKLQFIRQPLDAVAADLTAYFGQPFVLEDPQLAQLQFSGAFLHPTPEEVLDVLVRSLPVTYRRSGKGYRLQPESPKPGY